MRLWRILKNSGLQKQCQAKKAPRDSTVSGGATQPTETKRIKIEELYLMSNIKVMLPTQKDLNTEAMANIPPHPHRKTTCPIHSVFSYQMSNLQKACKRQTSEIWTALRCKSALEAKQLNQKYPRFE